MRPTATARLLTVMASFLFAIFTSSLHADDSITDYGIYLKTAEGYTKFSNVPTRQHLNYDFTGAMFNLTVAEPADERVEIVVYYQDFHPDFVEVQARSMGVAAGRSPLAVNATKLADDKFKLTAQKPLDPHSILLVNVGCCTQGVYGLALSEPSEGMASIFAEGTDHSPTTAEYVLSNVVDAVPDNKAMKQLHEHWQNQVTAKEAADHYAFLEKNWQDYENTESRERKVQKLEAVSTLAQQYLDKYPEGENTKQVTKRKQQADEKLNF